MKTGLTKMQKTTSIFFTDADERIEVCTHNTSLKNRLAAFAEKYPAEGLHSVTGFKYFSGSPFKIRSAYSSGAL